MDGFPISVDASAEHFGTRFDVKTIRLEKTFGLSDWLKKTFSLS
jgi:hypothetical protein